MKQFTLIIFATLCMIGLSTHHAQSQSQVYGEGSMILNAGIGFGGDFNNDFGISGSLEKGFWATGDFGVIGLGVYAGLGFWSVGGFDGTNFAIAPRGTYHFTVIPVEQLDVYAAIQPEIVFRGGDGDFDSTDFSPAFIAAARYYFKDNLGVFAELSTGTIFFTGGVCLSF